MSLIVGLMINAMQKDRGENDAESKQTASSKTYQIKQSFSVCTKGRDLGIKSNYLKKAGKCLNNLLVILVALWGNTHVVNG